MQSDEEGKDPCETFVVFILEIIVIRVQIAS